MQKLEACKPDIADKQSWFTLDIGQILTKLSINPGRLGKIYDNCLTFSD